MSYKIFRFGLIEDDGKVRFFDDFSSVGDAVRFARNDKSYLGIIVRILHKDGTLYKEKLLVRNSRQHECNKYFNKRRKHLTMDF